MRAILLGSAAGGGVPQWNCGCENCRLARASDSRVAPRTQASLAVEYLSGNWLIVNASPDLRQQIGATPELHTAGHDTRGSPVRHILLTGGEIDQIAGLVHLRERQCLTVHATAAIRAIIDDNPLFGALAPEFVRFSAIDDGRALALPGPVTVTPVFLAGKVPLYLEDAAPLLRDRSEGAMLGLVFEEAGRKLLYLPNVAALDVDTLRHIDEADVLLFDGTLFADEEMIRLQVGIKTARRMGHMPIAGKGGSLERLAQTRARRIYTHINNTNPVLRADSAERRLVEAAGWEVAYDGMEIIL